jgi:hypothetical protein
VTQAYPLHWPDGLPRNDRKVASQFKTQLNGALENVRKSLEAFGRDSSKPVTNIILSSNVTLGATNPADTGVAAWFTWDGEQRCIAVDRYPKVQDNLQAIHHIIEARRTEMRHGGLHIVRQTFKGFTALPAPAGSAWWEVLEVRRDASVDEITAAYRRLAAKAHPDTGGSDAAMARLNAARDQGRKERG